MSIVNGCAYVANLMIADFTPEDICALLLARHGLQINIDLNQHYWNNHDHHHHHHHTKNHDISTIIMQRIMTCAGLHSSISKSRHWGSEPPSQTCVMMRVVFMGFVVFMVLMIFMIFMVSMMIVSPLSGHSCTRSPVGVRSRKPTIHTLIFALWYWLFKHIS